MNQEELLTFLKNNPRPFTLKELKETAHCNNPHSKLQKLEQYGYVRYIEEAHAWEYGERDTVVVKQKRTSRSEKIITFLREHGTATTSEIYNNLGIDRCRSYSLLNELYKRKILNKKAVFIEGKRTLLWWLL